MKNPFPTEAESSEPFFFFFFFKKKPQNGTKPKLSCLHQGWVLDITKRRRERSTCVERQRDVLISRKEGAEGVGKPQVDKGGVGEISQRENYFPRKHQIRRGDCEEGGLVGWGKGR